MKYDRRLRSQIKTKIIALGRKANKHLSKPARGAIEQLLYGIAASQSVQVTKIASSLQENRSLGSTENRLTTRLASDDYNMLLTDYLESIKDRVTESTLLSLDPGDIAKPHGKKLEYLSNIRDGDTGNIVPGYNLMGVVATSLTSDRWLPLHLSLYSKATEKHKSENDEMLKTMDSIAKVVGEKGTWVIDRGGDRKEILLPLLKKKRKFLVRLVGTRHLLTFKGRKARANEIAASCKCRLGSMTYEKKGKRKTVHIGIKEVYLPGQDQPLSLIVLKGNSRDIHMLLLTTQRFKKGSKLADTVLAYIKSYLRRWDVEMYFRFIKQSYDYESVMVRSYQALKNITTLLLIVSGFIAMLTKDPRLRAWGKAVKELARRVGKKAVFTYYRIAEGLSLLLSSGIGFNSTSPSPNIPLPFASLDATWNFT
jgi:hypothetical protein